MRRSPLEKLGVRRKPPRESRRLRRHDLGGHPGDLASSRLMNFLSNWPWAVLGVEDVTQFLFRSLDHLPKKMSSRRPPPRWHPMAFFLLLPVLLEVLAATEITVIRGSFGDVKAFGFDKEKRFFLC